MSRKFIVNLIAAIVVGIIASTAIIFAWYTNTKKTDSIDYVSDGTVIQYTINGSNAKNVAEYSVEGVTFFDVNSINEGYYFTDMAICLEFDIANYSERQVQLTLEGESQNYTLSAEVASNVVSVYKYDGPDTKPTRETFSNYTALYTYDFNETSKKYGYSLASSYTAGSTYYERELVTTVTLTAANNVITQATNSDASIVPSVLNGGTEVAIEKYVAVDKTKLTADIFTAGNAGFYYTLSTVEGKQVYTHEKTFDSSQQYYELQTLAYLSDITISGANVTAVNSAVSGPYITCAISNKKLESKQFNYQVVDTTGFTSSTDVSNYYIKNGNNYDNATGTYDSSKTYYNQKPILNSNSVNSFLGNDYSNRYVHNSNLAAATITRNAAGVVTSITPGTSVKVYVYVYGVQPYDNATNNFLEDTLNVYPFKLTISAE